VQVETYPP